MSFDAKCLPNKYDVNLLKADLDKVCGAFSSVEHDGIYHDGGWQGISLISADGQHDVAYAMAFGPGEKTAAMQYCPYIEKIIDEMNLCISSARLLFLDAGKVIGEHSDGSAWRQGLVRLHIPIVSHEKVIMTIDGNSFFWPEGELWVADFGKIHSVRNDSDIRRVHVVIDAYVNENLLELLDDDLSQMIRDEGVEILPKEVTVSQGEIEKHECLFGFPRSLKLGLPWPIYAKLEAYDSGLKMEVYGIPIVHHFYPVSETKYVNQLMSLEFAEENKTSFSLTRMDGIQVDMPRVNNPSAILKLYNISVHGLAKFMIAIVKVLFRALRNVRSLLGFKLNAK